MISKVANLRPLLIGLTLLMLQACSTKVVSDCPPIVTYPKDFQDKAAAEMKAAPEGAALPVMIADYGKLRKILRVCQ